MGIIVRRHSSVSDIMVGLVSTGLKNVSYGSKEGDL